MYDRPPRPRDHHDAGSRRTAYAAYRVGPSAAVGKLREHFSLSATSDFFVVVGTGACAARRRTVRYRSRGLAPTESRSTTLRVPHGASGPSVHVAQQWRNASWSSWSLRSCLWWHHCAARDLLSLVMPPAVLESSVVLLLCAHRRGMAPQLLSQLVLPYAVHTLHVGGIAQCRTPPECAVDGRPLVCQSRAHVRAALQ